MTGLNHVMRRGAIYVWRRRLPAMNGQTGRFMQVSLRTSALSTAKKLAALANFTFADCIIGMERGRITQAEAQRLLSEVVAEELRRLEEERYFEPPARSPSEWRERYLVERSRTAAMRLVASRGEAAALFPEDRTDLAREGFSESDIARVEREIGWLVEEIRSDSHISESRAVADRVLARPECSDADLRALSALRIAARAEAMARFDRHRVPTPFVGVDPTTCIVPIAAPSAPLPADPVAPIPGPDLGPSMTTTDVPDPNDTPPTPPPAASPPARYSDRMEDLLEACLVSHTPTRADAAEQKKVEKDLRHPTCAKPDGSVPGNAA